VRRKHNYLPLILEMLKVLAENGKLVDMVKQGKEKQKARREKVLAQKKGQKA